MNNRVSSDRGVESVASGSVGTTAFLPVYTPEDGVEVGALSGLLTVSMKDTCHKKNDLGEAESILRPQGAPDSSSVKTNAR